MITATPCGCKTFINDIGDLGRRRIFFGFSEYPSFDETAEYDNIVTRRDILWSLSASADAGRVGVRTLLSWSGDDPDRKGLKDTISRVA